MSPNFTQTITVRCSSPAKLIELFAQWDRERASGDLTGYMGARVLADRERDGYFLILADFGVIDPNVSAAEEAARNNDLPETRAMGAAVMEILDAPPEYHDFDEVYRTDF